jgi:hypothetical protein
MHQDLAHANEVLSWALFTGGYEMTIGTAQLLN